MDQNSFYAFYLIIMDLPSVNFQWPYEGDANFVLHEALGIHLLFVKIEQ